MLDSGVGTPEHWEHTKQISQGLGLFIHSLVGLDRETAKQDFGEVLSSSTASADQIEFINLIIDHLTHHGVMELGLLYESPFTDISSQGPEGVFGLNQVDALILVLENIYPAAAA
ncbi:MULTISPECIES: type I restriction-modification enzyme R subunit C-terminal domain-containing protein [Trichocoleus]|uniref:EcoEI R protein C-terminal domain-containing protein n=1 Tax=Trichocoleus desertorum GB2-A4 TaxID=2933944 RepID=A0ABV0JG64_9CYAN|nr:type I restriction-modification enzyme R subunit C-terminal domain-containing protein [Trichocoleus sp. FACHB-46]